VHTHWQLLSRGSRQACVTEGAVQLAPSLFARNPICPETYPICPVVICLSVSVRVRVRVRVGVSVRVRVRVRGKSGWFARMGLGQIVRRANRVAGKLTLSQNGRKGWIEEAGMGKAPEQGIKPRTRGFAGIIYTRVVLVASTKTGLRITTRQLAKCE
jgi:hypothetical protein